LRVEKNRGKIYRPHQPFIHRNFTFFLNFTPAEGEKMALFRAKFTADDIYALSGENLAGRGVKLLLADLDNTLVPYGVPLPDEKLKAWRDDLTAYGVTLFILSNNRHESRPRTFAQALEVPYIGHAGKPKTPSFVKAMEQMGVTREQTAIVGDQVFTDVLGGNRAGVTTILVRPIRLAGNPGRYLRYAVEVPFRLLSGKGEKL
jgi:hypothetical protein